VIREKFVASFQPFNLRRTWGSNFKAEVLWDACYRVSSLINQFIASSRVLNLGEITLREGTSGGCQKTLNGLSPLSG
jgi:hypothetical protein